MEKKKFIENAPEDIIGAASAAVAAGETGTALPHRLYAYGFGLVIRTGTTRSNEMSLNKRSY